MDCDIDFMGADILFSCRTTGCTEQCLPTNASLSSL